MISTSALAKKRDLSSKELFSQLADSGLIERDGEQWLLTDKGKAKGGEYKDFKDIGKRIVWPENVDFVSKAGLLTATRLGEYFSLSAKRINAVLAELGWMKSTEEGWKLTPQGKKLGAQESQVKDSNKFYVRWPEAILENVAFKTTVAALTGNFDEQQQPEKVSDFRQQMQAKIRTTDGHFVKSHGQMLIDNWLYMAGIAHACERRIPVDEELYSDFYIPSGRVYIEYWDAQKNTKITARRQEKLEVYEKYAFNLIRLSESDIENLDELLPALLLQFGIKSF